jgi:hypothetical protein
VTLTTIYSNKHYRILAYPTLKGRGKIRVYSEVRVIESWYPSSEGGLTLPKSAIKKLVKLLEKTP